MRWLVQSSPAKTETMVSHKVKMQINLFCSWTMCKYLKLKITYILDLHFKNLVNGIYM